METRGGTKGRFGFAMGTYKMEQWNWFVELQPVEECLLKKSRNLRRERGKGFCN